MDGSILPPSPDATDMRAAFTGAAVPDTDAEKTRDLLAVAEDLAEDYGVALAAAKRANDRDALPPISVEAIVAAEGLAAAAKALEAKFSALKRAAKAEACRHRAALADWFVATGERRVEASGHAATPLAGSLRVVITGEGDLPPDYLVTTVRPELARIGKALADGEAVPGAKRDRGPATVTISAISETPKKATAR